MNESTSPSRQHFRGLHLSQRQTPMAMSLKSLLFRLLCIAGQRFASTACIPQPRGGGWGGVGQCNDDDLKR